MKKIIHTLYIITIAIDCSGDQSITTSDTKGTKIKNTQCLEGRIESNQ